MDTALAGNYTMIKTYTYRFSDYAPECEHEYDNACDVDCNICGENREVEHTVLAVEAVAPTCEAEGNIAYWYCSVCGSAWLDAECKLNTNLQAVKLPLAEHEYFYACDAYCMNCGEKTNPDAVHDIIHEEAKPGTDCLTWDGNIEYWTCSYCHSCWDNANATGMPLNAMTIKVAGPHSYFYACDKVCQVCGEETNPDAAHNIVHVEAKAGTDCQTWDGNVEYWYCDICGYAWLDEALTQVANKMSIQANGDHNFVDGVCTVCGEEDVVVKFDVETSVTLANSLTMNLRWLKSNASDWAGSYAVLTRKYANGSTSESTIAVENWTDNGDYYSIPYAGIAAKEMGDEVTIVIYNANGTVLNNDKTDSIEAYAYRGLDALKKFTGGRNAVLRTALVDMLNYGAWAQTYFGYDANNLVNADLTDAQKAWASAEVTPNYTKTFTAATEPETSLILESSIRMKIAFFDVTEGMYINVKMTGHDGTSVDRDYSYNKMSEDTKVKNKRFIVIDDLKVADYQTEVTVTLYNADGSVNATVTDTIEGYVDRVQDSNYNLEWVKQLKTLTLELLKFSKAAHEYFHYGK